jgi:hypothetical protein
MIKRNCEMNGIYSTDSRELPTNGSVKIKTQMLKWLSIIGSLSQLDELSLSKV